MAKQKEKFVQCRYPKCKFLHETTSLNKNEAVTGGKKNYYYHPDCYHTMKTVNEIRDLFLQKIDRTLIGKQVGMLVSTINNIVFTKNVDVDFLKFAIEYFIKNKPGALKHPAGLHYIVQDRDVVASWQKLQQQKIRDEIKEEQKTIEKKSDVLDADIEPTFVYKPQSAKSFVDIFK